MAQQHTQVMQTRFGRREWRRKSGRAGHGGAGGRQRAPGARRLDRSWGTRGAPAAEGGYARRRGSYRPADWRRGVAHGTAWGRGLKRSGGSARELCGAWPAAGLGLGPRGAGAWSVSVGGRGLQPVWGLACERPGGVA